MKIIVVGAGHIGTIITRELAASPEVTWLRTVDVHAQALERLEALFSGPSGHGGLNRPELVHLSGLEVDDYQAAMAGFDVAVLALPTRLASYRAIEAAIREGVQVVDILEEYHRRPEAGDREELDIPPRMTPEEYGEDLHRRAIEAGIIVLDGMGFAPGLTNVTLGEGIRALDEAHSAIARAGGIPNKESAARHPLGYMITWAFDHVLRLYVMPSLILQDGQLVEAQALTGRESLHFQALGRDEHLEVAITPGMPSFVHTRPHLREFAEKTIRWPGHWAAVDALKEAGMLDLEPVEIDGHHIVPRDFLVATLAPRLRPLPGDGDACIMWNTVTGIKDGQPARLDYLMWEEADPHTRISAMGRVTAYPAAVGALLVGRGLIAEKGIVAPEDAIYGESYRVLLDELSQRGITIEERRA
ncbi:MAG: saccharopine dehydrogenase family protein [Anaerolineae bacterium]